MKWCWIILCVLWPASGVACELIGCKPACERPFVTEVMSASKQTGVEPELLWAVMAVESGMNPRAVSRAGAKGLMQLMPITAKEFGVTDPFDPSSNVLAGARLLRRLIVKFDGNFDHVMAAYNAGHVIVVKVGGIPSPRVRRYVRGVYARWFLEKRRTQQCRVDS